MNTLVDGIRKILTDRGLTVDLSDDDLTLQIGQAKGPELFDRFPDFAADYQAIREANAPSLTEETTRAFKSGTQGLASTALGGLGLFTGSDYLKEKAKSFDDDASANGPTIPTLEDIAPGEKGFLRKAMSRDALRYGLAKVGSVAPSIGESVATAAVGSAIGSAMAPGPGTLAGAAGGALESGLVKSAIRSLLKKGVAEEMLAKGLVTDATEAGLEQALKSGSKTVANAVSKEAAAIGAFRGGVASNAAGSLLLNSGDVASEGADTPTTIGLGIISALPDTILPAYVLSKLFPGVAKKEAVEAGKTWLVRNAKKLGEVIGVPAEEFGQEYFQEAINVVAKNIKNGVDPLTFDDADLRRLREAGIAGAAGGLLAAPGVILSGRQGETVEAPPKPTATDLRRGMASDTVPPPAPTAPVTVVPPARRVALMTDEQRAARLAELTASENTLSAEEQQELELLRALTGGSVSDQAPPSPLAEPSSVKPAVAPEQQLPLSAPESGAAAVPVTEDPFAATGEENTGVVAGKIETGVTGETPVAAIPEQQPQIFPSARESGVAPVAPEVPIVPPSAAAPVVPVASSPNPIVAEAAAAPVVQDVNLPSGEPAPVVPQLTDVPPAPVPSPTLEDRLREELKPGKAEPFSFGTINESSGTTVDLRSDPRFESLTPEMAKRLPVANALDESGNRAKTRVAVVLEAPDGHIVKTGLLVPQEMTAIGGGEKDTGPAVQSMAAEKRAGGYQKLLKEGGNRPALLADVIAAGYKLRAIIHFNASPGSIFQRFSNAAAYDASYAVSPKSTGSAAAKMIPTQSASEGVSRRNAVEGRDRIQRQIDQLGNELQSADPARSAEINDEIKQLYADLGRLPEPRLMTAYHGTPHAVDEFTTDRIGSGEGAASYGWGLYFAENKAVAEGYRKRLARANAPSIPQLREYFTPGKIVDNWSGKDRVVKFNDLGNGTWSVTVEGVWNQADGTVKFDRPREHSTYPTDAAMKAAGIELQKGNLYTVDIADELIGHMLDWDAPLSKQPEAVKRIVGDENSDIWKALKKGLWQGGDPLFEDNRTGADLYRVLADKFGTPANKTISWANDQIIPDDKAASLFLLEKGVPGIKYLDAGSRTVGEGTRNFVVFDGNSAKILAENGMSRQLPQANTEAEAPTLPSQADRANQFATVAARLRQAGAKVDVFAKAFLQAQLSEEYKRRIESLIARYQSAPEKAQPALQRQIESVQATLASMDRVRGVTYSAGHIALGLADVQSANLADLVTLLHEAGHSLLQGNPAMQARVLRSVEAVMGQLRAENEKRTASTGSSEAKIADPEELLVQTLAQRLAEEGVPEAPSLARAVVQWVKDLYYRLAMAVQASFGVEPSPSLAIGWFDNQLRRLTGGDYDYRFGDIFNRWSPEAPAERANSIGADTGTPGGLTDFHDPITGKVSQPEADPTTRDAVGWNLRFATDDAGNAGAELDIPFREAKARIMAAAINEEATLAEKMYAELEPAVEGKPRMTFDQFWAAIGRGDTPKVRLAELDQQAAGSGTATIGGEKMTDPMNQQARVQAKRLIQKWEWKNIRRIASDTERSTKAEAGLVEQAKLVNKIEGDLRNAEMHEATLRDSLKEMIRTLSKGMRRGLDTAFAAGELAQAVREAEDLGERDAIPEEYQRVFKAIMADEVPVFEYLSEIAKLDMPLGEMTRTEIIAGIRDNAAGDPALSRLIEPRNKPLLVALTALAKRNAEQMDLIQLRAIKDPARYLAIKAELDEIRNANEQQLKAIAANQRDGKKAATFADRIKRNYVNKRAKLRRMQATIQEAQQRTELLEKANVYLAGKVTEIEAGGLYAPSEWTPADGAKWTAMRQAEDGTWRGVEQTLRFTPEGPAVDAEAVRSALAQNRQWLEARKEKAGTKLYETVMRQTLELQALDLQQRYPEGWRHLLDKMIQPLGQAFAAAGGAGARIQQMLNNFQFINKSYWHGDLETLSLQWTAALRRVEASTGMKDHGAFFTQIYDPVLYYLQAEPGREEGPALREAVRAAKRRLPSPPAEGFDETFKDFMRRTKAISERYVAIAEQHGAFVKDSRLGGDLRRAVAQGWLTVMRRVNTGVVGAITRDMQSAGWSLEMEDDGKGSHKIARSSTFDKLMEAAYSSSQGAEVMENPEFFSQAISGFFTPNIIRTWLEPFLNKPGEPLFRHGNEQIDQLDVQQAWQDAAGNVAQFIDRLGAKVGLTLETDAEGNEMDAGLSPEGEWRASMLRQIERLFVMESRIAYDSAQTKNLFDPMGPKPHVVMDARLNELIPPEHLQHVVFDPMSSKNLLATLAFHGAFGRNGERMTRTLDELKSSLTARKNEFESLTATTESERKAQAQARGIDYAAAKKGARTYHDVMGLQESLKAQFGFNSQSGALGDMRTGLEMLHFVTGQTVNNPKTAFLNLLQPTQRALVQRNLGKEQALATGVAYAEMAKQVLGSILENFGLHIMRASEHARDIGVVEGQGYGQLPWSVVLSDIGKRGRFQDTAADKWAIKPLRSIAAIQRKGIQPGFGDSKEFSRLNVIPGVGGIMSYASNLAATSNGRAEVWAFERIVKSAIDYFAVHPDKATDPAFRLTADDLGLKSKWWFSDEGTFDYYRRKSVEYGVGNLEDIARGAMERQTTGQALLTREQALRVALMAGNELDLQASMNTRPAGWSTNPILKFGLPLLGWPLAQMNQVHQALKTADGRASWTAALKGLGIMAAWSLPMGLAFTLMTDEYDDKILRKKSGLASATSPQGVLDRLSKAGNIYGVGADFVSSTLGGADPTSGQRPFSLDQRVLVFSQFMTLRQGLTNWINGGAATWSAVERPFMQALGGNGILNAIDVYNGLLGLDNDESRLVQRTNAFQWLRSAGREAGIELRGNGGGSVAPTPTSIQVREMMLAALANDRMDFLSSYRKAIDAAREDGKPNPEQAVLDSWKARDPLDVFHVKPSDAEMNRMLSLMSDTGRQAVNDALRLFQQYTSMIAPSQADIYEKQILANARRTGIQSGDSIRRQMAGASLSVR